MRESTVESALVKYAKSVGVLTYKFTSPSNRGVPDRVFIGPKGTLFLEIKAPGKKPTPLQAKRIVDIQEAGGKAGWCSSVESGKAHIDLHCIQAHIDLHCTHMERRCCGCGCVYSSMNHPACPECFPFPGTLREPKIPHVSAIPIDPESFPLSREPFD